MLSTDEVKPWINDMLVSRMIKLDPTLQIKAPKMQKELQLIFVIFEFDISTTESIVDHKKRGYFTLYFNLIS